MANITLICCTIYPKLALLFLKSISAPIKDINLKIILVNSSTINFDLSSIDSDISKLIDILEAPGLSLSQARNLALSFAGNVDIIAFPDDDCTYPPGLIDRVVAFYNENSDNTCKGISFPFPGSSKQTTMKIRLNDIFGSLISFNFFIFNPGAICFNENFGIGAKYDFGEESELVARILGKSHYIYYDQNFLIDHPIKDTLSISRSYRRGCGIGAFLYITSSYIKFSKAIQIKLLLGSLVKSFVLLAKLKFRYSLHSFVNGIGRLMGFFRAIAK